MKKLTIRVSDEVYEGLHRNVGRRRISQFLEGLARPHVLAKDLEAEYRDMAADEHRIQRLGFMAGQIVVPDDFDRMGGTEIARFDD
jgi:predicted CopG family antitoxin